MTRASILRWSRAPPPASDGPTWHRLEPINDGKKTPQSPSSSPPFDLHQECDRARVLSVIASANTSISGRFPGVTNGPIVRTNKIHDLRRGRHRRCLRHPRHLVRFVIAAKAYTPEYAFHAYLFAAGSVAAVFAIVNRYFDRPAGPAPLTIDGKPNYNMGPVKFATVAVGVLGHRRLHRRALDRARARLSGAQFRPAVAIVRPHAAAAHLGGDLRLRRQRADRDLVLCRAAHLPRAHGRRHRALVRRARLQLLHRHRRHRLSARHHPVEGICRAGMVCRSLADRRVGRLSAGLPRHASCGARSRTSTSRTGSISPSS